MSINRTPKDWVAGEALTAADLDAEVRELWDGLQAEWDAYTPTLNTWTVGNGTLAAVYRQVGLTIDIDIDFTVGNGTISGTPSFSLPATARLTALGLSLAIVGQVTCIDTSTPANNRLLSPVLTPSNLSARAADFTALSATYPFTWAAGDRLHIAARYEAV